MLKKDLGICIRAVDYSDTSQVLTFFCKENGKISAIAKGAKRKKSKFGGAVEVLSFGELIFSSPQDDKLFGLREFEPLPRFLRIRSSLTAMNCGFFAAELVNHFSQERHPEPEVFDLFCELLKGLQGAENETAMVGRLILFQLGLLEVTGFGLIFDRCCNCGNSKYIGPFLSSEANGIVCLDCQMSFVDKVRLSNQAVDVLANRDSVLGSDMAVVCEVERGLIHHFSQIMNRMPRLGSYFLKL